LLIGIWNAYAPRFADGVKCGGWIEARANEDARRDECRTSDSGTAVHGDRSPFRDPQSCRSSKVRGLCERRGHAAVRNGKGNELHRMALAEVRFLDQTEFGDFVGLEQTDDDVNTLHPPPCDFVCEPISGTWARHDGKPAGCSSLDPVKYQGTSCLS
jgi:hypothetical protein